MAATITVAALLAHLALVVATARAWTRYTTALGLWATTRACLRRMVALHLASIVLVCNGRLDQHRLLAALAAAVLVAGLLASLGNLALAVRRLRDLVIDRGY